MITLQALIDKLTRKHPDVKPKEMLIPNKYRDDDDYGDEDDDEDWDGLGSEENGGGFGGKSRGGATERSAAASSAWMTHRSRDGDIGDPGLMMMGGPGSTGEGQGKVRCLNTSQLCYHLLTSRLLASQRLFIGLTETHFDC